jgi:hypothetical protein
MSGERSDSIAQVPDYSGYHDHITDRDGVHFATKNPAKVCPCASGDTKRGMRDVVHLDDVPDPRLKKQDP